MVFVQQTMCFKETATLFQEYMESSKEREMHRTFSGKTNTWKVFFFFFLRINECNVIRKISNQGGDCKTYQSLNLEMEYDVVNYTDALVNAILFFVSFYLIQKKNASKKEKLKLYKKKMLDGWWDHSRRINARLTRTTLL